MRMKAWLLTMVVASRLAAQMNPVAVYLINTNVIPETQRFTGMEITTGIFREIGVDIDWHIGHPGPNAAPNSIQIEIQMLAAPKTMPGALAYARPIEGTKIVIFYESIRVKLDPAHVLAHVMAHEIGHILQGIVRHSPNGIMKSSWSPEDFRAMPHQPLTFTTHDVKLIHTGIVARMERLMTTRLPK